MYHKGPKGPKPVYPTQSLPCTTKVQKALYLFTQSLPCTTKVQKALYLFTQSLPCTTKVQKALTLFTLHNPFLVPQRSKRPYTCLPYLPYTIPSLYHKGPKGLIPVYPIYPTQSLPCTTKVQKALYLFTLHNPFLVPQGSKRPYTCLPYTIPSLYHEGPKGLIPVYPTQSLPCTTKVQKALYLFTLHNPFLVPQTSKRPYICLPIYPTQSLPCTMKVQKALYLFTYLPYTIPSLYHKGPKGLIPVYPTQPLPCTTKVQKALYLFTLFNLHNPFLVPQRSKRPYTCLPYLPYTIPSLYHEGPKGLIPVYPIYPTQSLPCTTKVQKALYLFTLFTLHNPFLVPQRSKRPYTCLPYTIPSLYHKGPKCLIPVYPTQSLPCTTRVQKALYLFTLHNPFLVPQRSKRPYTCLPYLPYTIPSLYHKGPKGLIPVYPTQSLPCTTRVQKALYLFTLHNPFLVPQRSKRPYTCLPYLPYTIPSLYHEGPKGLIPVYLFTLHNPFLVPQRSKRPYTCLPYTIPSLYHEGPNGLIPVYPTQSLPCTTKVQKPLYLFTLFTLHNPFLVPQRSKRP